LPRSKYTKVPGLLRPIEHFTPNAFQFDNFARRELIGLLPLRLHQLGVPEHIKQAAAESSGAPKLKTMAEFLVCYTQNLIGAYFTELELGDRTPTNPANVKAAIRKLRKALLPFVRGGLDEETASIIPDKFDKQLERREHEVEKLRSAPYKRRRLDLLCEHIGIGLTNIASANKVTFEMPRVVKFITTALDYAGIVYSYSKENPARFANRVFPKSKNSK